MARNKIQLDTVLYSVWAEMKPRNTRNTLKKEVGSVVAGSLVVGWVYGNSEWLI